ncbi:MAG: hypothetical protein ABJJ69_10780 [Paracoccaceae bacterium]
MPATNMQSVATMSSITRRGAKVEICRADLNLGFAEHRACVAHYVADVIGMHAGQQKVGDLDAPADATRVGCKAVVAAATLKAALRVIFGLVMFDTHFLVVLGIR